jgi:hypothetical protein
MSQAREWYRWKRRGSTELYLLWGVAALTYGGGDVFTTIVIVYGVPGVGEANPIVRWGLATLGPLGLIAMKSAAFGIAMYASWIGLKRRDLFTYYTPPVCMILVGITVTLLNLRFLV